MPQSTEPRSAARCSQQLLRLTSNAVLRLRLEEIKGCCCSIWHREVLAVSVRMRWSHSPHFSIKGSLDMSTLPPDQRRNVPGRGSHLVTHPRCVNKLGEHISKAITNLPLVSKHSNKQNCFCYDWTDSIALHSLTRAERLICSPCWEISTKRPKRRHSYALKQRVHKCCSQTAQRPGGSLSLEQHVASQPSWPSKLVKYCKSVLIEAPKPAGLSHMDLCKHSIS